MTSWRWQRLNKALRNVRVIQVKSRMKSIVDRWERGEQTQRQKEAWGQLEVHLGKPASAPDNINISGRMKAPCEHFSQMASSLCGGEFGSPERLGSAG